MNNKSKWGLLFGVLLCAFIFVGCTDEFSDDKRVYIENYGNLHVVSLKKGNIELYVENTVCDTKEETEVIFEKLESDYNLLQDVFDLKTKVKVYVIEDEYVLGNTHGAYIEGKVYCNLDSIENGDYRMYFTGAYLNTSEPWKYYGASEYVFGTPSHDTEVLTSYYTEENNLLTLSLFAAYFNDSFANTETIEIAQMTATAFGRYVIDTHGKQAFLGAGLEDYRQEWLTAIGVDKPFDIAYDISWLVGAEYSQKLLQYPLVIKTDNRIYYMDSFSAKRESAAFDTPESVLKHLSVGYSEIKDIIEYTRTQTQESDTYRFMRDRFNGKIEYYISDREIGTEANVDERKVYLLDPSEYVHETAHILTMKENTRDGAWLAEGIAEYFSREICNAPSDIDHRMYLSFTESITTGALNDFVEDVKARFTVIGGTFASFDGFDFYLLEKAIAYVTLTKPEYKDSIQFPYATTSVADTRYSLATGCEGNALTYPEAYLFTTYLIENYGLDKVLSGLLTNTYDFEKLFFKTYSEVFARFVETLS